MKVAGRLLIAAALLGAALLALLPTSVTLLGTSGTCGMPIVSVGLQSIGDSLEAQVANQCRSQSWSRVITAGAVAVIGIIAGGLMINNAPITLQEVTGSPFPVDGPPGWRWDGKRWVPTTPPAPPYGPPQPPRP